MCANRIYRAGSWRRRYAWRLLGRAIVARAIGIWAALALATSAFAVEISTDTTIDSANSFVDQTIDVVDGPLGPTTVTMVSGGVVGGVDLENVVELWGASVFNMTGGTVFTTDATVVSGPPLVARDTSTFRMTGGVVSGFDHGARAYNSSQLFIDGGRVFSECGNALVTWDRSRVTITGGEIVSGENYGIMAGGASEVLIVGGTIRSPENPLVVNDSAIVTIRGGAFDDADAIVGADHSPIWSYGDRLTISGGEFFLQSPYFPGEITAGRGIVEISGGEYRSGFKLAVYSRAYIYGSGLAVQGNLLTGTLADGHDIEFYLPNPQSVILCNGPTADINCDNRVNDLDLAIMASNFGVSFGAGIVDGDLTGDGRVSLADLLVLQNQWGLMAGESPAGVREPAGWHLVALAFCGFVVIRVWKRIGKNWAVVRCFALTAVIGAAADTSTAAQPLYRLTDLGNLPAAGESSLAYGINDGGQVVGMACNVPSCDERGRAFLWTSGVGMQDIGSLPGGGEYVVAYGINNAGQVVGVSDAASTKGLGGRAFNWNSTNGMQDLGDMPGGEYRSGAYSINESGHIAGTSASYESGYRAFFWSPETGKRNLGHLQSNGYDYSQGIAINDSGHVVGSSNVGDTGHAFLWTEESGMLDLGALSGETGYSDAWGISNLGEIVGTAGTSTGYRAYLRTTDGQMHGLGDLSAEGLSTTGIAINDGGEIVGNIHTAAGTSAFLWSSKNGIQDLNLLLDDSGDGWFLREATAINNIGQIVGSGTNSNGDVHAFLLTPIGQPGDINLDGIVDRVDAALFARYFGTTIGATWRMGDFTGDGRTSLDDLSILQRHLIADASLLAAPASSVPEPSTMFCAIAGVALLTLRIHRRSRVRRRLSHREVSKLVQRFCRRALFLD